MGGSNMTPRSRKIAVYGLILLVLGLSTWGRTEATEPTVQILTGEVWQTMPHDTKVAFVWGLGNLLEFERHLGDVPPATSRSFLPPLIKGLQGKTINDIVHQVDAYYRTHADQRQLPVINAIFQAVVIPSLQVAR
jgi:hypothetical protein